jgi:hypothetical protein
MFVIPGHPALFGIVYFVCISCVSLLFHNLATNVMDQVRQDAGGRHLQEHTKRMLNTLADMVTSRRQGGPVQSSITNYVMPAFEGFCEFLQKLKLHISSRITSMSRQINEIPVLPQNSSPSGSFAQHQQKVVTMSEDHYLLMSMMPVQRSEQPRL